MATAITPEPRFHPEVDRLLDRLRSKIRSYVLAEGAALVAAVVAGLFWLTLAFDLAYFRLTNLELPVAVRATLLIVAVVLTAAAAASYLALRLARRLRARALALVLERRFPELNDRLILAVETAERLATRPRGPLEEAMLSRAVDDVAVAADRLDVADVFDRRPLRRAATIAAALLVPILLLAVVRPPALKTWWAAYGRLAETYHARMTTLRVVVLAPPDDRPRPLEPGQVYHHPRGTNLTILLNVPEGYRPDGRSWAVPQTVYARRRTDTGGRQTLPAVKTGDRQFRLTIDEVRDGADLWITGGDYTNRASYRIEVVDPPRVERVELVNYYPRYTGLNDRDAQGRPIAERVVLSGPVAEVPNGTLVLFRAKSNKPIRNARLRLGESELVFGEFGETNDATRAGSLTLRGDGESSAGRKVRLAPDFANALISADRREIEVPLLVSDGPASFLPGGVEGRPDLPKRPVVTVSAETPIRITLEDTDLVASLDPSRFDLRGRADTPPEVKTELRGVSGIITRRAVIPLRGGVRDDHGVESVRFDFRIDDAEGWTPRTLDNPPQKIVKDFTLRRDRETASEWLDTATLGLKLGQKLTLAVAAEDADHLTGPHLARGDQYVFMVVTDEELLSSLYNQEINLRKRFEQSLGEMRRVREDLTEHRGRTPESTDDAGPAVDAIRSAADRSYSETQQNAGEVRAVEGSFGEILEQLVNNRVHTEKQLDRIRVGILEPLQRLSNERFPRLDRAVGELRLRIADGNDPRPGFDASVAAVEDLIAEMEAALKEMQDLAEFHEAIQELNRIFEDETRLLDRTKEEQKRSVIEGLGDLLE